MIQAISPAQSAIWVERRNREPLQVIVEVRKRREAVHKPPPHAVGSKADRPPERGVRGRGHAG